MRKCIPDAAAAVAGLIASCLLIGFHHLDFSQPLALVGDHTFVLTLAKEALMTEFWSLK